MTLVEAARRLGVHETAVRTVEDRENDAVVTLRDGSRWLVSETVSRPYVAEVDDVPELVEEPDDGAEPDAAEPEKPAKRHHNRRPAKG